jgi:hypothetical protein
MTRAANFRKRSFGRTVKSCEQVTRCIKASIFSAPRIK